MKSLEDLFNAPLEEQEEILNEILSQSPTVSLDIINADDFEVEEESELEDILEEFKLDVIQTVSQIVPEKGDKGDKGDKGEKGKDGKDGRDGLDGKPGKNGKDGVDGKDGVSVVDATIAADNSLVFYLSDGSEIDAGSLDFSLEQPEKIIRASTTFGNAVDFLAFNTETPVDIENGQVAWNSVDKTLDIQHNNVTQQVGQESFALVRNRSGSTITNGMFVRFSGAEDNGVARVLVEPFLANGTYPNLFGLGIATEDIADDADGFVTVFGKVRGLNTTNTGITSETWQVGDVLYASPTQAGKLTRVKPTAPNNVIPVAAVLRVDPQIGELFIRPTYEQKRTYGTFADKTNQTAALINTPYAVTFNTTEVANGHSRGTDTSHIIAEVSGLYNYKFSIQFVSTNSSAKDVFVWFRRNGNDIPDSATRLTITGNGVYDVAAWDISVSMNTNDYFQIMWATTDTTVSIAAPAATTFCPAIPSVLLTVTEVAL